MGGSGLINDNLESVGQRKIAVRRNGVSMGCGNDFDLLITATEVESCFYRDGKMECSKGEFQNTYYRDGDKIVRTNVTNFKRKEYLSDNTVYTVIGYLLSDPRHNDGKFEPQIVRAIGYPGLDAVEILSIGKNFMQAVKSTSDYFVICRFNITRE